MSVRGRDLGIHAINRYHAVPGAWLNVSFRTHAMETQWIDIAAVAVLSDIVKLSVCKQMVDIERHCGVV
jgi:hypothetical protein